MAMRPAIDNPQRSEPHLQLLPGGRESGRTADQMRARNVRRVLLIVLGLNLSVAAAKLGYGLLSGSLAMTADGVHSALDGGGNIVALVGIMVAARPPDPNHPYGHQRYETLTSLGIAGLMLLTLFGIIQSAIGRLGGESAPEVTTISFGVMLATLAVNLFVTVWERREGRRHSSSLLLADARHTTSDLLVSLSVIASLVAVQTGLGKADAGVALLIAAAIAWGAWTIVRDASLVLSDAATVERDRIERVVRAVPGVRGAHNIRSRGGEGRTWVDLHIQVDPELPVDRAHEISSDVARQVEDELGEPSDVTVHIEPADERHLRNQRGYEPGR